MMTTEQIVAHYPTALLEQILADIGQRNLRDYRDNETRWLAERASAVRKELRRRKAKS
jgi:hypothetical protein